MHSPLQPLSLTAATCVLTATCCNTLHHAATRYNTLPHTATRCNTMQHAATHCHTQKGEHEKRKGTVADIDCCNTRVDCNKLQ